MCAVHEKCFYLPALDTHTFKKMEFQPAEAKKFFSTVRKEMALLATSLPDGIMVKTFEDRMVSALLHEIQLSQSDSLFVVLLAISKQYVIFW